MSLHTLANHLQSAGRGEDKILVHMTPGEVNGLQKLAMAHGGSLTTNPQTGLPEAGFLSSMLPMIAGIALAPATGGASLGITQAWQTAALVGGVTGLATGSLSKGLMAGLGAFGGAGMGEGLMSMGAKAAIPAGANMAGAGAGTGLEYGNWMASNAGQQAATQATSAASGAANGLSALSGSPGSYFDARLAANNAINPVNISAMTGAPPPNAAALVAKPGGVDYNFLTKSGLQGEIPVKSDFLMEPPNKLEMTQMNSRLMNSTPSSRVSIPEMPELGERIAGGTYVRGVNPPVDGLYNPQIANANVSYAGTNAAPTSAAGSATGSATKVPSKFDQFQAGVKASTTNGLEGIKELWNEMPAYSGLSSIATAYNLLTPEEKELEEKKSNSLIRPYTFNYNPTGAANEPYSGSGERVYFNPTYTAGKPYRAPGPEYAAEGGLMAARYAVGGQVEEMSAQNAIGSNQSYPQSQMQSAMYSNPMMQRPQANNVINSGIDAGVNPYTGEAKFAEGGETTGGYKYGYDPKTQQFTQISAPKPVEENPQFTPMGGGGAGFTGYNRKPVTPPPVVVEKPIISGGLSTPFMPPNQPQTGATVSPQPGLGGASQNIVPNISIPAYQTPEQQLGLEAFYPMMDQQLAARGAQMVNQGYAEGGYTRAAPLNQKMASIDTAAAQMKTPQGLLQIIAAAKKGDQAALIALQKSGYDMNKLNEFAGGGGISTLGGYSDGGRLLRGPGDGVSDSIPAVIGNKQPARLADGEFVVPARIVSELGNGSTEAGAKKLYAMMKRVQSARKKSVGKNRVAVNSRSDKYLPA